MDIRGSNRGLVRVNRVHWGSVRLSGDHWRVSGAQWGSVRGTGVIGAPWVSLGAQWGSVYNIYTPAKVNY